MAEYPASRQLRDAFIALGGAIAISGLNLLLYRSAETINPTSVQNFSYKLFRVLVWAPAILQKYLLGSPDFVHCSAIVQRGMCCAVAPPRSWAAAIHFLLWEIPFWAILLFPLAIAIKATKSTKDTKLDKWGRKA